MFSPSASSTYSSASAMMRTQPWPNCAAMSGSAISASAATMNTISLVCLFICCMACSSSPIRDALAHQAGRPQGEHQEQHQKGEDLDVLAAEHAAGELAEVARADRLDEAQQDAS